jgi:hypothetical protein
VDVVDVAARDRWVAGPEVVQVPTDRFAFVLYEPEPNPTSRTVCALAGALA